MSTQSSNKNIKYKLPPLEKATWPGIENITTVVTQGKAKAKSDQTSSSIRP